MIDLPVDRTALVDAKWWSGDLGPRSSLVYSPSRLVKRMVTSKAQLRVDNDDCLGVALNLSEDYSPIIEVDRRVFRPKPRIGSFCLLTPGQVINTDVTGNARYLILAFSLSELRAVLSRTLAMDADVQDFETRFDIVDPSFEKLMYQLAVVQDDSIEYIVVSLIQNLLRYHRDPRKIYGLRQGGPGLTPARLRLVLEQIETDLPLPLHLSALAETAGMSAFHFARQFRVTTGMPPHQYVIRRRVDRAIALMSTGRLPIELVARKVGFNRAAHLASHMRRLTGITPGVFARQILRPNSQHDAEADSGQRGAAKASSDGDATRA